MGHYVYKYVYNNEIIYIGKNDTNLISRLNSHGKIGDNIPEEGWSEINNSDIFYCELANSTMSDVIESELIRRYKPKYNKAKTSEWSGINFEEPNWVKFVDKDTFNDIKTEKDLKKEISNLKYELNELQEKRLDLKKEINLYDVEIEKFKNALRVIRHKEMKYREIYSDSTFNRFNFYDMLYYYYSVGCDTDIEFSSELYDEDGALVSKVKFKCEEFNGERKIICYKFYFDYKKGINEELENIIATYPNFATYNEEGIFESKYGLKVNIPINEYSNINKAINLQKIKTLNNKKNNLFNEINNLEKDHANSVLLDKKKKELNNIIYYINFLCENKYLYLEFKID